MRCHESPQPSPDHVHTLFIPMNTYDSFSPCQWTGESTSKPHTGRAVAGALSVSGRIKTSHSRSVQNQPVLVACNLILDIVQV
jgi:hypothetical protein